MMAAKDFTHVNPQGKVNMVDVGGKLITSREAIAEGFISLPEEVSSKFMDGDINTAKGPVFQTAILAGIMAVKRTSELIPLCHNLPLTKCDISIQAVQNGLQIQAHVRCDGKTGVEMEALTGVSVAALTVYDMCKSFGHDMQIGNIKLVSKKGGKRDFDGR